MKKVLMAVLTAALVFSVGLGPAGAAEVEAASIKAPKTLKVKEGFYYTYWDAHRKALEKAGFYQADISSASVKWSKVSGADGYKVKVTWESDVITDEDCVDTINVKKRGNKYYMSGKRKHGREPSEMAKSAWDFCGFKVSDSFTTKRLAIFLSAQGSVYKVKKVTVRSYKIVNGKKVWSKAKTKKYRAWG